MLNYIDPLVGDSGFFEIQEPFSITKDLKHEVIRVTTLSSLITEGIDPYDKIYAPLNIDMSIYTKALSDDMKIVTLRDIDGEEFTVPLDYFLSKPLKSTYDYQQVIITLNLGFLEVSTPIENLKNEIRESCRSVTPEDIDLKVIVNDSGMYVSEEKHEQLEAIRKAGITNSKGYIKEINDLKLEKEKYLKTIADQQALIESLMQQR